MAVKDPEAWVERVERLYRANDAEGKIYHKHTIEIVEPYDDRILTDLDH